MFHEGCEVGKKVGAFVSPCSVGLDVCGLRDGAAFGAPVGILVVGTSVGVTVGCPVGCMDG